MTTPLSNQIIREITPLSDKDCFYIAERYKTEFTYLYTTTPSLN